MREKLSEDMTAVIDYILSTESEDYVQWCADEGLGIDDENAINRHVFGSACKVLRAKPSELLEASPDA